MTDRIKGLTVALDRDYRDDDVQAIVDAILMVKGVAAVEKSVVDNDEFIVYRNSQVKIIDAFREESGLKLD